MKERRVQVIDARVFQAVAAHVVVGKAFAFVGPEAFNAPETRWVARMLGSRRLPRVVSLLDRQSVALFGTEIETPLPAMFLASVTADKGVYRADRDVVHLLVVHPFRPGSDQVLEILANGAWHASHPVRLDEHGAAALEMRDLPAGEYEVRFRGEPAGVPACTFTVAEYRLAPLVASITRRRLEGALLSLALRVETFGVPVEGSVNVELMERGTRAWRGTARARAGRLDVDLTLEGPGPFTVNLQLADHPGRTATVPLVGSRAEERSLTPLSLLGTEVHGSLMPVEGARPVRGVWLSEGAARTTPFRLERVDARVARIVAQVAVQSGRVVVLDPAWPAVRSDAVDPADPGVHQEPLYQSGDRFFHQGEYAMALTAFREGRSRQRNPHPYFAYYEACCLARLGRREEALAALCVALADGWKDLEHMAADLDLAALQDLPAFHSLLAGGVREVPFESLSEGQILEVEMPGPAAVLAIGAFVRDQPWEGWAATIAPSAFAPTIELPQTVQPATDVEVRVRTGNARSAAVYLVVKDARLPSLDTPENRLAGRMKAYVEDAASLLQVGQPKDLLLHFLPPPSPPPTASWGPPTRSGRPGILGRLMAAAPTMLANAAPDFTVYSAVPAAPAYERQMEPAAIYEGVSAPPGQAAPLDTPVVRPADDPEVVFAGLLQARDGTVSKTVRLGPAFADYVVEAFLVDGVEWEAVESRFQAARQPFVNLETPAFVHSTDHAVGRILASCNSGRMQVNVTRDGHDVPLLHDGQPTAPGPIEASRTELSFSAPPGEYRAVVTDLNTGDAYETVRRVEVPGRLRRTARQVRLLQPGEAVGRGDDPSIRAIRVLPGLEKPFTTLVEATADYGHACCEQTAAKMLAACAMYVLGGKNGRRTEAESIILAGVKREESMWLRGRGFKMYPESSGAPNDYYGAKAARYLWNLGLLRDGDTLGRALSAGVDRGLEMAQDTCGAYHIEWPPTAASNCEEAWNVIRFGREPGACRKAVDVLRATSASAVSAPTHPWGFVGLRADCAFAAAGLLRGGSPDDVPHAMRLANRVIADLGPEGRLYSTVDSVAAIAMMGELNRAGVAGGGGRAEVNGRELSLDAAARFVGEIDSVRSLEGTVSVEVERIVEEDWDAFGAGVDVRVALEQDGRTRRAFKPGDALELSVTLAEGYKAGDLLWVCLPDALSRLVGGAQVKRFAVDFAEQARVLVPLVATAATSTEQGTPGKQHFAVCVRNMFEEERAASPGLLDVVVQG